jgi:hypothetical protein
LFRKCTVVLQAGVGPQLHVVYIALTSTKQAKNGLRRNFQVHKITDNQVVKIKGAEIKKGGTSK